MMAFQFYPPSPENVNFWVFLAVFIGLKIEIAILRREVRALQAGKKSKPEHGICACVCGCREPSPSYRPGLCDACVISCPGDHP